MSNRPKGVSLVLLRCLALCALLVGASATIADELDDGKLAMDQGKFSEAMAILLPLAEAGNAQAQFFVGVMHTTAAGVPANSAEAVRWFLLAAEQDNVDAQYSLGQEYALGGPGLERDRAEAYFWLVLATDGYEAAGRSTADSASQFRDSMANKLSPEELAKADQRVAAWRQSH